MTKSKKPTHVLKVKQREGEGRTTIGAGWLNEDGSMSLALNPCVVLSWTDDVVINAFPIFEDEKEPARVAEPQARRDPSPKAPAKPKKKTGTPLVVIPRNKSKCHDFVEEEGDFGSKVSFQFCTKCEHKVTVDVPFAGILCDSCPVRFVVQSVVALTNEVHQSSNEMMLEDAKAFCEGASTVQGYRSRIVDMLTGQVVT